MQSALEQFIEEITSRVKPLSEAASLAGYDALLSGKEEDYNRSAELMMEVVRVFSDKQLAGEFAAAFNAYTGTDELVLRSAAILNKEFKRNAGDPALLQAIVEAQTEIENLFSTFRTKAGGKTLTDNQVEEILENSVDNDELREVWEASKEIGVLVADKIRALAGMRNRLAETNGYTNYHDMSLRLDEQDPVEMTALFDKLHAMTLPVFSKVKAEMDEFLAKRLNITTDKLRPWHYHNRYFQEAPKMYSFNPDDLYRDADILQLTKDYFTGIAMDITPILEKSDMFEREGKYQHACCNTVVRNTDVRVIMNLKPNYKWMNTSLHEFGHAVYDRYIDDSLPWLLKEPAHIFTTEAIAMLFGRFALTPGWIDDNMPGSKHLLGSSERLVMNNTLRNEQLIFSRWAQVVYRFEAGMYANPSGDLNGLWKQLVEKYQLLTYPEGRNAPDWASKIHIAAYPCYYHNYQLGELLASQLLANIGKRFYGGAKTGTFSLTGNKEAGAYLLQNVFTPGNRYRWDEMITRACGEPLNPAYYAEQFT